MITTISVNFNFQPTYQIQEGARVMFLTNKLFNHGICNGTIGIVTKIIDHENIKVTFPTHTSITKIIVQKETTYFEINGICASCQQFPLQNAFALMKPLIASLFPILFMALHQSLV